MLSLYIEERHSFIYREESVYPLYRKGRLLRCTGEGVSLFFTERRETHSVGRGESVSLLDREGGILLLSTEESVSRLHREDDILLLYTEERVPSRHRGESVPLLYVEEADSFSIQRRECLLYTEETVSLCYM